MCTTMTIGIWWRTNGSTKCICCQYSEAIRTSPNAVLVTEGCARAKWGSLCNSAPEVNEMWRENFRWWTPNSVPNLNRLAQRILNWEDPKSKQFFARAGRTTPRARPPTPKARTTRRGPSRKPCGALVPWPVWAVPVTKDFCRPPVQRALHVPRATGGVGTGTVVCPPDRSVNPESLAPIRPAVCAPRRCNGFGTTHRMSHRLFFRAGQFYFLPAYRPEP